MALANTIWPAGLPAPSGLKTWLATLFETVDSKAPDSGDKLAALYSADGIVYGLHGKSEGSQGMSTKHQRKCLAAKLCSTIDLPHSPIAIAASRKTAWDKFESRKHEVLQVFCGKADYSDIIMVGKLTAGLTNGNQVVTEFIAHIEFEGDMETSPKGTLYKVWGYVVDSVGITCLMER